MSTATVVPFEATTGPRDGSKRTTVTIWRVVEEGSGDELLPMNTNKYAVEMFALGYNLAEARRAAQAEEATR